MKTIGNSKGPTEKQIRNILSNLHEKFPTSSFSIQSSFWHHKLDNKSTEYNIFIIPGLDGTECQMLKFASWSSLISRYRKIVEDINA